MNIRAIAVVVFLVVTSGGLLVHFRQQSLTEGAKPPVESGIPVPPKSGPFGKFVVEGETVHDFGVMELGQKGTHEFKIRNDGPGPLKLVARKEDHTCQCTLGTLARDGLQPGEETTVTMEWEIKNPSPQFEHSAKIRTDDPANPVTTFRVRGIVGKRLSLSSGSQMMLGTLPENKVTERLLTLHSETADAFEITKLEASTPLISATSRPLSKEELKQIGSSPSPEAERRLMEETSKIKHMEEAKKKAEQAGHKHDGPAEAEAPPELPSSKSPEIRSGHELKVTFQPGFAIGKFRESLSIETSIPDTPPMVVMFEGNRAGPVQILGTPGISWSPEDSLLRLGRFPAKEGKKARLLVFIKKSEEPWEVTGSKITPSFLKYELIKDDKFKGAGRDRFDLMLEVPAGQAPLSLSGEDTGSLILETNHPEAKTIKIALDFTSF